VYVNAETPPGLGAAGKGADAFADMGVVAGSGVAAVLDAVTGATLDTAGVGVGAGAGAGAVVATVAVIGAG
jgi:hypothetical protein